MLFAQTDTIGRFTVSIGGGLALPVGSYASHDANEAAVFRGKDYGNKILGFSKKKNGFAETGYSVNLDIDYSLSSKWFVFIRGGYLSNKINTETMVDFFHNEYVEANVPVLPTTVDHDDMNVLYLAPGIGYQFRIHKLHLGLSAFAGWGWSNYPGYLVVANDFFHFGQKWDSPHLCDGCEAPNLSSAVFGGILSVKYFMSNRVSLGLEISYFQSGFDYTMQNYHWPGGGPVSPFDDTVVIRLFNPQFKVGYSF